VHLFTASGVIFALRALHSVDQGDEPAALLWLGAALIVDGMDGTFARAARVREQLPNIDGNALDLVVDYLTYVFIPAFLIWRGGYLSGELGFALTAAILVSSLYVFARQDMKTQDGYFRGFPALWNVVALYFVVGTPPPWLAAMIVTVLIVMTFAPVHVVHPFRVRDYGAALPAVAIAWGVFTAPLVFQELGLFEKSVLLIVSVATAAVLLAMGLLRTVRGPRAQ
jgi:phosphatidylcholine synthase